MHPGISWATSPGLTFSSASAGVRVRECVMNANRSHQQPNSKQNSNNQQNTKKNNQIFFIWINSEFTNKFYKYWLIIYKFISLWKLRSFSNSMYPSFFLIWLFSNVNLLQDTCFDVTLLSKFWKKQINNQISFRQTETHILCYNFTCKSSWFYIYQNYLLIFPVSSTHTTFIQITHICGIIFNE